MAKDQKVTLNFVLNDGSTQSVSFVVPAGADGTNGTDGKDGKDGSGVTKVTATQEDVE